MVTKVAKYKPVDGYSTDGASPREKAMANRTKSAHGDCMHNDDVVAKLFVKDGQA
jgi:hypothetical protein